MKKDESFDARLAARAEQLGPTELRVAQFLRDNREAVLVSSASALAARTQTSDATVIRTVKALGYEGMAAFRQELASELRDDLSLASRMVRTIGEVGAAAEDTFGLTLQRHVQALELLKQDISPALFQTVVVQIAKAPRVRIFGIGPSSAMASYFAMQLGRFGIDGGCLTNTGLLLADELHQLRPFDLLIVLAFGRPYREVIAVVERAEAIGLTTILLTDSLGPQLKKRVDHILPVVRGRADALSLHTATLGLIEALLVGVATKRPTETVASLKLLNALRLEIAEATMDLPAPQVAAQRSVRKKRRGP